MMIVIRQAPKFDEQDAAYAEVLPRYTIDEQSATMADKALSLLRDKERRLIVDWYTTPMSRKSLCKKHDLFFSRLDDQIATCECHWEGAYLYLLLNQRGIQ